MVLSREDLEQFVELGWCRLPDAFTRKQAAAARAHIWRRMETLRGVREEDPATWPDFFGLEEHVDAPEVVACFTPRLCAAIEQIVGPERWAGRRRWGLWPINFSLHKDRPWQLPQHGWHIDGNWFRHTLDCPKQGLLLCGLFSDVAPHGGGTLMAQGSHKRTARVLAAHPGGLPHRELFDAVLEEPIGDVAEATGVTGDVLLVHPFLFHTRAPNHSDRVRFVSNTEAGLRAPMRFDRAERDHSLLEVSIKRALAESPRAPAEPIRVTF